MAPGLEEVRPGLYLQLDCELTGGRAIMAFRYPQQDQEPRRPTANISGLIGELDGLQELRGRADFLP